MEEMTNREIDQRIVRILFPIMCEYALMMVSSIILTSFIGRLAVDEISIYGLSTRISNIYFALFRGMGVGLMILSAKAYGQGNIERCRWLQHQSYETIMPPAIIMAVIAWIFARPLLSIMTKDPMLLDRGVVILKLMLVFMPLQALIGLNTAAFQAFGNTKTPMLIAGAGNVIAIISGIVLIFGIGGFGGFGLRGAAMAQIVSWAGMALIGLYLIYGPKGLYKGVGEAHPLLAKPDAEDVKTIYRTGIPVALENSYWNVATVYISRVILFYGSSYYAAYQLGLQAEGFCDVLSAGFMTGAMTLSSMAIGAMDDQLYRRYFKRLNFYCLIVCFLTMSFLFFGGRPILRILTDKEELIMLAMGYLVAMVFSQIPQHMAKVISGFIRTSGHEQVPMIISFLGIVLRVALVILFGEILRLDIIFVWWAFNADLWFRYIVSLIYGKRKRVLDYISDMA
ncbi:MAG: MATE family efflux transporter [Solobacterium sp.]|nr:MATE family efflux transporter [Solobacterium sp.]